jgi:hypothetical protein
MALPARQFEQGQRVAPGLGDDPLNDALVEAVGQSGPKQGSGIGRTQPVHLQVGQAGENVRHGPSTEGECDSLRLEPPGRDREGLGRLVVDPLGVVDDAQHRPARR